MRRILAVSALAVAAAAGGWGIGRFGGVWPAVPAQRQVERSQSGDRNSKPPGGDAKEQAADSAGSGQPAAEIASWESVEDFAERVAVFRTVFWDPRDTISLRRLIRETPIAKGKSVLEIGTGSGLLALCCLKAGARSVVATDVNSAALRNAAYNARLLELSDRLELRRVPLGDAGAYSVIADSEKFDLIVSNPPWEEGLPTTIDRYAYYDPQFRLLRSLLEGLPDHLAPGGKALLAYGSVDAVQTIQQLASQHGFQVRIRDDRNLDDLPDVFLPGMLLEVAPGAPQNPTAQDPNPTTEG